MKTKLRFCLDSIVRARAARAGVAFFVFALLALVPLEAAYAGQVTETIVAPSSITDLVGTHTGSVSLLDVRDQIGTQNDAAKYVQFGTSAGQSYQGYRSYFLPNSVTPSQISTITLIANVLGPSSSTDAWTWSVYNWTTAQYDTLGNQNNCGGPSGNGNGKIVACAADQHAFAAWKWLQYNALGTRSSYVNPSTREIRVQLTSANASNHINVDYESLSIYSNNGIPTPLWIPPINTRWQWQIQANAGVFTTTNGINVNVCQPTYKGGSCVKPSVFDIDLFVDNNITGSYDGNTVGPYYAFTTDAVNAIHASGRKVIGYITVGDAENWRADFQQMVDFDVACGHCFIGKAFSSTFPNEWYVNINNDMGQADFMRKMVQARMDKVAAAGFDSVEPDVDFNSSNDTGFTISGATQIAYNVSLATMAHANGLSINLKSDVDQAQDSQLIAAFDYVLDEQCWEFSQCSNYSGFQSAGKSIFNAEYTIATSKFCAKANNLNFNSIKKNKDFSLFDLPWTPCR